MTPSAQATVAELAAADVRVWWKCEECRASGDADLARIITAKGGDYCLTDRTAPCRTAGCSYWVMFYGQAGMRNWPLRTDAGFGRLMRRRSAWLTAQQARNGGAR